MALIKNEALINEELDPKLIIVRLKKEVEELRNQLAIANNGEVNTGDLTQDEIEKYILDSNMRKCWINQVLIFKAENINATFLGR